MNFATWTEAGTIFVGPYSPELEGMPSLEIGTKTDVMTSALELKDDDPCDWQYPGGIVVLPMADTVS